MDFKNIGKVLLPIGAAVLTVASAIVSNMNQKAQMDQAIAEKVAEALSDKAKEL